MIARKYTQELTQRCWSGKHSRSSYSFYPSEDHGLEQALSMSLGKLLRHCVKLSNVAFCPCTPNQGKSDSPAIFIQS